MKLIDIAKGSQVYDLTMTLPLDAELSSELGVILGVGPSALPSKVVEAFGKYKKANHLAEPTKIGPSTAKSLLESAKPKGYASMTCIELVSHFEGFYPSIYLCPAKVLYYSRRSAE